MKRTKQAMGALLLAAAVTLSGCGSMGFDAEDYLMPPRPNGVLAEIQDTLEAYAGADYTLKYPRSGEYRSAIILKDLDSDGQEEALAFYRPASESGGTHFVVIDVVDHHWKVVSEVIGPGVDVERVVLTHFDHSAPLSILVGWNMYSRDKVGTVYYYAQERLTTSLADFSYTEMLVDDFNGDGCNELFALLLNTTDQTATARLLSRNSEYGRMQAISELELDGNISAYAQVQSGNLAPGQQPGVILDEYKSSTTLQTEIVYWNVDQNALSVAQDIQMDDRKLSLLRDSTVCSRDINQDGVLEFPTLQYCVRTENLPEAAGNLAGGGDYSELRAQKEYYLVWMMLTSPQTAEAAAYSVSMDAYYFLLPPERAQEWMQSLYYKYDETAQTLTFYSMTDEPELQISAYTDTEWSRSGKTDEFTELKRANGTVYAVQQRAGGFVTQADIQFIADHFYFN